MKPYRFLMSLLLPCVLALATTALLHAQDPDPEPTPTGDDGSWVPPASGTPIPEPTPVPDTTPDPNATPPPPDSNGSTPPPSVTEARKNATTATGERPVEQGGDVGQAVLGAPNADIPDPTPAPVLVPTDVVYENGGETFRLSLSDEPETDPDSYQGTFNSVINDPETSSSTPAIAGPETVSPTMNSDISTVITTGGGYDLWTGSARRTISDIRVAGAVGAHPLAFERTYSSHFNTWSYSYTWRLYGKPYSTAEHPYYATMPDGRTVYFGDRVIPGDSGAFHSSPGTKERLIVQNDPKVAGLSRTGRADLYLGDGSVVHFERSTDTGSDDHTIIDSFTPMYMLDPNGHKTDLVYEQWGPEAYDIRLAWVIEDNPAVAATYRRSLHYTYMYPTGSILTRVESTVGQTGGSPVNQWAQLYYSPTPVGTPNVGVLTSVYYSDGTHASYTYGTADVQDIVTPGSTWHGTAAELFTANDTRAEGAMRAIRYEYPANTDFRYTGQILAEHHLEDAIPGTLVSKYVSLSDRTNPVETRGDGPDRAFHFELAGQTPLMRWREDFKGVREYFDYDDYKFLNKVTDRRGNITQYTNEPILGNPTRITYGIASGSPHVDYTYYTTTSNPAPYFVKTATDELTRTTTYTRDSLNRVTRIDYPDTSYEAFTYNGLNQVLSHRRKNGFYEWADYTNRGLLIRLWSPSAGATHPDLATSTVPRVFISYYGSDNMPAWTDRIYTITNERGYRDSFEYDRLPNGTPCPGRGLVTKITHMADTHGGQYPGGTSETFGYDVFGNKIWEKNEMGYKTTYTYDDYNRLIDTQLPPTTEVPDSTTHFDYTASNGRSPYTHTTKSWQTKSEGYGFGYALRTRNLYDENFRVTSTTQGYLSSVAATTTFDYDNNGNQTSVTSPRAGEGGNFTTTSEYDTRNRKTKVTDPLLHFNQWIYDDVGNVTDFQRLDGQWDRKQYDTMHRVISDTDPMLRTTLYSYWPSGKMKTLTDPENHVTTFYYDESDMKSKEVYPAVSGASKYQEWAYDQCHNLLWRRTTDPSIVQVFAYDARNRKSTMRIGKGVMTNGVMTVDPNNTADWSNFTYDGAGRLVNAKNGNSTIDRIYDEANRLKTDKITYSDLQNTSRQVDYYYNALNQVYRRRVPSGGYDFVSVYDGMGRLSTLRYISDASTDYQYWYDAASNVKRRYCYLNGTEVDYTYDHANRMTDLDLKRSGSLIWHDDYTVDNMNRLTGLARAGVSDSFTYDTAGQLKTANYGAVYTAAARSVTYNLDDAGNRTSVKEGSVTKAYTPNAMNQYTTADSKPVGNGNVTEISGYLGVTYKYYGDTYLSSVSAGTGGDNYQYVYDALGRRVEKLLNNVPQNYYLYDGEHWITEYNGLGALYSNALYGNGIDEVISRGVNGQAQFFLPDRNGNTMVVTGGLAGASMAPILEGYRYDAFGLPTIFDPAGNKRTASVIGNRLLFTGREWNSQFGFYEYRARAYHPGIGRFMSEDPKGFDAGDYNLYRYCDNDPWDLSDPTGLDPGTAAWSGQYGGPWSWSSNSGYEMDKLLHTVSEKSVSMAYFSQGDRPKQPDHPPRLSSRAIAEGRKAVDDSMSEMNQTGLPTGYNVYIEPDGTMISQKANKVVAVGFGQYQESYPKPPSDKARLLVNGHVHKTDSDNKFLGSSFSPPDVLTSGFAPVMKNNSRNSSSYDILYRGWRWLLHRNGTLDDPAPY